MGLRSKSKKATTVETKTVETEAAVVETKTETEAAVDAAVVETEKAVATTTKAAPPAVAGKLVLALKDRENAIPPVDFGTLPRVKANQGTLICEDEVLGKVIEITVVSFNNSFAVTPNENGADSSYCKFSYDGENLNDGSGTVAEHIAYLKSEGFGKACAKRYLEVICILDDAEEDNDEIGNMVQLSLSPQSVKQFERYQLQSTIKIKQGKLNEDSVAQMRVVAKTKTFGKNTFTLMSFQSV